ncbi:DUF86 domain-containing protein [Patescibacteria group bacterium]|nr:DUF86 domain-containing protein [Patescibacteria group bacterium]MBU4481609.1 DUF86 domain-containing protein [Patescibacteria group bacterium]
MSEIQRTKKFKLLKKYFEKKPEVLLAFLFGSRAKKREMWESDWDVGIYFKSKEYLELETEFDYPEEEMWQELTAILKSDNVDLVVLNRARPSLVYSVLRIGIPLAIKDKKLYFDLLCKVSYEARDWWKFVDDYCEIKQKAKSISSEAKSQIKERLDFLIKEFGEINEIKKISWKDYLEDSFKQKIIERWIERIVMASIDISQIVLASEKRQIPESYQDTLKVFWVLYIDENSFKKFGEFAKMRNVVAHEYLDIKWKKIQNFIKEAEKLCPKFIEKAKKMVK